MAEAGLVDPLAGDRQRSLRELLPFIARLLAHGVVQRQTAPLPLRAPSRLAAEAVTGLVGLVRRSVWAWLLHGRGWRRVPVADAIDGRRMDTGGLPPLDFSAAAIDACIAVHACCCGAAPERVVSPRTAGDQLFLQLLYEQLPPRHRRGCRPVLQQGILARLVDGGFRLGGGAPDWSHLDGLEPWLPWVSWSWSDHWLANEDERWHDVDACHGRSQHQAQVLAALLAHSERHERADLLQPALRYVAALPRLLPRAIQQYERLAASLTTLADRRELAEVWWHGLAIAERLTVLHRQLTGRHPIERTDGERCLLAVWDRLQVGDALATIRRVRHDLLPELAA